MYINLLSQSNYSSYNIYIAKLFGLQAAVYIAELISISEKAMRKKSLVDGYVFLNRDYVLDRTTVSIDDQLDFDSRLESLGILEKRSVNEIKLNIKQLAFLVAGDDEPTKEEVVSTMKKAKRLSKRLKDEYVLDGLKRAVNTQCEELREAYYDWIDSVFAKDGFMSKKAVIFAQEAIDAYSNRDLDKALSVLNIASINAYRDMTWAINQAINNEKNNLKFDVNKIYNKSKKLSVGAIIE